MSINESNDLSAIFHIKDFTCGINETVNPKFSVNTANQCEILKNVSMNKQHTYVNSMFLYECAAHYMKQ